MAETEAPQRPLSQDELVRDLVNASTASIEELVQAPTTEEADSETVSEPESETRPGDVGPDTPPATTEEPEEPEPQEEETGEEEPEAETESEELTDDTVSTALDQLFQGQESQDETKEQPQKQDESKTAKEAAEEEVKESTNAQLEQGIQQFTLPEAPEFTINSEDHEAMLSDPQEMAKTMKRYGDNVALHTAQTVMKQLLPLVAQVQTWSNENTYRMHRLFDNHPEWNGYLDSFEKAVKYTREQNPNAPPHKFWPKVEETMQTAIEKSGAIAKGRRVDNRGPAKPKDIGTEARQPARAPAPKEPEDPTISAYDRLIQGR